MLARRTALIVLVALAGASLVAPVASGDHCATKINVYGRFSLTPIVAPPYASATAGICVRVFEDKVEDHVLPPNTDQVIVRIHGDFGPAIPTVDVSLTGLGFAGNTFTLVRTLSQFGGYMYAMPEWVALPDGPVDGELIVTAAYPGGARSVTYHTTATVPIPDATAIPAQG